MHILVWGSILIWFVIIPVTSTGTLYSSFFRYGGVAYEVLNTANFWFYLPMATVVALFPTIVSRLISLYRNPTYVDFVRLKEKKEGKKLFKRKKLSRKPTSSHSTKRSGYAFSHEEGFGTMISTGRIFGMDEDNVAAEHVRRRSVLLSASPSRAGTEPPHPTQFAAMTAASVSAAVLGIGGRSSFTIEVVEDRNSSTDKEQPVGIPRERKGQDDDRIVFQSAGTHDEEGTSVEDPVEQTDSALMPPPLRIPGLVDSPDQTAQQDPEKDAAGSGDQESGDTTADSEKVDVTLPLV